jgi:hypothetical protein
MCNETLARSKYAVKPLKEQQEVAPKEKRIIKVHNNKKKAKS